ncbi:MAG TPA: hypothetical protein VIY10_12620 [Solirubrobacteraceae bacterium]
MTRSGGALLGLVAALVLASSAGAAALPSAVADGGTVTPGKNVLVRPKQIIYTGDGSGFLAGPGKGGRRPKPGKLKWSSWTSGAAVGSGDDWLNNCEPFCAAGTYSQHAVNIKLYRPRKLLGLLVFTRMSLRYTHGPNPFTHKRSETLKLTAAGKLLFWNIGS